MIKIEFSDEARKYILDRTGEVTVNLVMLGG